MLDQQNLVGEWEVEQQSAITGDKSASEHVKCRFSIVNAKAAFLDSQNNGQVGVGQSSETDALNVLDYEEFKECVARCAVNKYSAVKQMTQGMCVEAMIQNMIGEKTEEDVMRARAYISAERFDRSKSQPRGGTSAADHEKFLACWDQMQLDGLHGFPIWEEDVHNALAENFVTLSGVFDTYCKSLADKDAKNASEMDMQEFQDFAVDVGLETPGYAFAQMGAAFTAANKSGKGAAGPPADAQLQLYEFLNVLVRVSFWRMNPTHGQHGQEAATGRDKQGNVIVFTPVPQALKETIKNVIVPNIRKDNSTNFRETTFKDAEVQKAISEHKSKLQSWWENLPFDPKVATDKLGMEQWVKILQKLNTIGTFECTQGSDVTGDPDIGTKYQCRLSVPQAKQAFMKAQGQQGDSPDAALLEFSEMEECIARCAVDKYRGVKAMNAGQAVDGFCKNILGEATEEEVITAVTYKTAPRYDASGDSSEFGQCWAKCKFNDLHGFPLWEKEVYDALNGSFDSLKETFLAYCAGLNDVDAEAAQTMDMDEFHDFVIEAELATKEYSFDVMTNQFNQANAGSGDKTLDLAEFLQMVPHIAFWRQNPEHGLQVPTAQRQSPAHVPARPPARAHLPLPSISSPQLAKELALKKMPNAPKRLPSAPQQKDAKDLKPAVPVPECVKTTLSMIKEKATRGDAKNFKEKVLSKPDVQKATAQAKAVLAGWYVKAKEGLPLLTLKQYLALCEKQYLFSELTLGGGVCRFTVPQAKAAYGASAAAPNDGMTVDELIECVARCGVDKYKGIADMREGASIIGFVRNLLGEADEEVVVNEGEPRHHRPPPRPSPPPLNAHPPPPTLYPSQKCDRSARPPSVSPAHRRTPPPTRHFPFYRRRHDRHEAH